jgi:2-polyprenyl-3-methyl-5-hydroxy-6-metoxy-1,4-benzoquinol methylase
MTEGPTDTSGADYAERLVALQQVWWKRLFNVQAPYGWNLRRLNPGRCLEIGCGIGRNLAHLRGNGVGVDHNEHVVAVCRKRGLTAYTTEEFLASREATEGSFDSLLLSHVVEHTTPEEATELLRSYLPFIRPGGLVIFETPQEVGYKSDSSHRRFADFELLTALCAEFGVVVERRYSFPFPRPVGRLFIYNEFVETARLPA